MAYSGRTPISGFRFTPTKDTFSGNNSDTQFTLSVPTRTNDVEVFVENIQQEPVVAYSISGTTLTFTSAPPTGTGNIYVIHRGELVETTVHPSTANLDAVDGTFTGDVAITGTLSVTGESQYMSVANTNTLVNDRLQVANAEASYVSLSGDTMTGALDIRNTGGTYANGITIQNVSAGNIGTIWTSLTDLNIGIAGAHIFTNYDGTSERMRIDSDGLKFNGDTAAVNALNDYEEGTWDAFFRGASTTGTFNYTVREANYTKIGNLVTCFLGMYGMTLSGASGALYLSGLPFVSTDVSGTTPSGGSAPLLKDFSWTGDYVSNHVRENTSRCEFWSVTNNGTYTQLNTSNFGTEIFITFSYTTSS